MLDRHIKQTIKLVLSIVPKTVIVSFIVFVSTSMPVYAEKQPDPNNFDSVCKFVLNNKQIAVKNIAKKYFLGMDIYGLTVNRIDSVGRDNQVRFKSTVASRVVNDINDSAGIMKDATRNIPYFYQAIHGPVVYESSVDKMVYRKVVFRGRTSIQFDSLEMWFIVEKFGYVYGCMYKVFTNIRNGALIPGQSTDFIPQY